MISLVRRRANTWRAPCVAAGMTTNNALGMMAGAFVAISAAVGCSAGSAEGMPDGTSSGTSGTSTSSTSSSSGQTCDLKKESWYSECSKGCGDVMACQSFCSGCSKKCMVPCETSSDCEAVGAGSCEISAKGSNRCSGAPTKCN